MDDLLLQRYSRHILLDEIGIDGQRALNAACVLIVGGGGLGCPAAQYCVAAGIGKIIIADDDCVDLTNLQRQILHPTAALGTKKAHSAKNTLTALNPHCQVVAETRRIDADNACEVVAAADAVLDCSDNYETRHVINRACVRMKTPLIFGAASGFDGQTALFDARDAQSPCYSCLFAESGKATETPCALMGVFSPLTGIIGCWQAATVIKLIAAPTLAVAGNLWLIEARHMKIREIKVPRDRQCEVCGNVAAN